MSNAARTQKQPERGFIVEEVQTPTPAKKGRFRLDLANLNDVCDEIARVYRSTKRGEIESSESTRLVYILNTLRQTMKDRDDFARQALEMTASGGDWEAAADAVRKKLGLTTEEQRPSVVQIVGKKAGG